jgi:hypothetical protein
MHVRLGSQLLLQAVVQVVAVSTEVHYHRVASLARISVHAVCLASQTPLAVAQLPSSNVPGGLRSPFAPGAVRSSALSIGSGLSYPE